LIDPDLCSSVGGIQFEHRIGDKEKTESFLVPFRLFDCLGFTGAIPKLSGDDPISFEVVVGTSMGRLFIKKLFAIVL
jgi:hypothetical protein